VPRVVKSDAEWKQQLSSGPYLVTRHAGTERPFTGNTWDNHKYGIYRCICCEGALFSSETKFESDTDSCMVLVPMTLLKDEGAGLAHQKDCAAALGDEVKRRMNKISEENMTCVENNFFMVNPEWK
jgi:hypothetical protein